MSGSDRRTALSRAGCLFLLLVIALVNAASSGQTAEPLSLETIRSRLKQQQEKIRSLHLRVRLETTLNVDRKLIRSWPHWPTLPRHVGTDEVLIAFKARKRYIRVLELDYRPGTKPTQASPRTRKPIAQYLDETKTWMGEMVLQRQRSR